MKIKSLSFVIFLLAFVSQSAEASRVLAVAESSNCPWAGEDKTICSGECVTIGCDTPPNDNLDLCFSWVPTESISSGYSSHGQMVEVCPTETTTYTIFVTNSSGELIASDEVTVVVAPQTLTIESEYENSVCQGATVELNGLLTNGTASNYLWSTGETTPSILIEPEETTNYSLTVVDQVTGCELHDDILIVVNLTESRQIFSSSEKICEQEVDGFTGGHDNEARSLNGDCTSPEVLLMVESRPGDSFLWSTGNTESLITVFEAGEYSVTITNPLGCEVTASYVVESCAQPEIEILIVDEEGTSSNVLDAGDYFAYEWETGETTQTINANGPGYYSVTVENENGCIGEDILEIKNCETPFGLHVVYQALDDVRRVQNIIVCSSLNNSGGSPNGFSETQLEQFVIAWGGISDVDEYERVFHFYYTDDQGNILLSSNEDFSLIRATLASKNHLWFPLVSTLNQTGKLELFFYCQFFVEQWQAEYYVTEVTTTTPPSEYSRIFDYQPPNHLDNNWVNTNNEILQLLNIPTFPQEFGLKFGVYPKPLIPGNEEPSLLEINLNIQFFEEESAEEDYVLLYNGEVVENGSELSEVEGTSMLFGIGKLTDSGYDVVESVPSLGVENTIWRFSTEQTTIDEAQYSITVPAFSLQNPTLELRLGINTLPPLTVNITPAMPTIDPGYHVDNQTTSVQEPDCIVPQQDYTQFALNKIQAVSSPLYNETIGNNERQVVINLFDPDHPDFQVQNANDIVWGRNEITWDVDDRLSLDLGSVLTNADDCPITCSFFLKISFSEFNEIKMAIEAIDNDYVPPVVDKIMLYDPELGNNMTGWCQEENQSVVDGILSMLSDDYYVNARIGYKPSSEEVEELIYMSNLVHVSLNYRKLLEAPLYGQIFFSSTIGGSGEISMSNWYNGCGNYPNIDDYNQSKFKTDLNKFRELRFTNTLAHELGHIRYAFMNKVEFIRWKMMLREFSGDFGSNTDCYLGPDASCATHIGHEVENPDGADACAAENIAPTQVFNGARKFIINR